MLSVLTMTLNKDYSILFLANGNFEYDFVDEAILLKMAHEIPLCVGTKLIQFNMVNLIVADALAPCVARSAAAMILTL